MSRRRAVVDRVLEEPVVGRLLLGPIARRGYRRFRQEGQTSRAAYTAMRKLYASRDLGAFDRLVEASQSERPPEAVDPAGGLIHGELDRALAALESDGLAVLDTRLPVGWCDELEATARSADCSLIGAAAGAGARRRFDPDHPVAVRYDVDESTVLASPVTQRLLADPSLLALAQRYLGGSPVQDLAAMWWSAPGAGPSSEAAQQFHHDLDRLRFVKLFAYLTDVDEGAGPHVFVRGSHRSTPTALRADRRFDDEEVMAHFGPEAVVHVTGGRGTLFLADTRGLHKGMPVQRGHRLVFQLEWATSLYGYPAARHALDPLVPELAEAIARHPAVFERLRPM